MENSIFFIYLAVAVFATSAIAIVIRRLLAVRGRITSSKKRLESFLTSLSESYYKAYFTFETTISFGKKAKKMRELIENDLSLKFNHLFCNFTHFPNPLSLKKDYIDESTILFVDNMIPVLESLQQNMLLDKYSRPSISTLQKVFFDRLEIEIIYHLSTQDDDD